MTPIGTTWIIPALRHEPDPALCMLDSGKGHRRVNTSGLAARPVGSVMRRLA
ncbi:hypothetical protein AB5J62_08365 [Amycolatopsis sp. cg5]|uniref:hypothetical protein n=1 Tax=Amycolatopsis sp. cg5 TaxID=3238802 RepID=UPI003524AC63